MRLISFPSLTEMFHFSEFPPYLAVRSLRRVGLSPFGNPGLITLFGSSSRLIVALHVLHRHVIPRHSLCTRKILFVRSQKPSSIIKVLKVFLALADFISKRKKYTFNPVKELWVLFWENSIIPSLLPTLNERKQIVSKFFLGCNRSPSNWWLILINSLIVNM